MACSSDNASYTADYDKNTLWTFLTSELLKGFYIAHIKNVVQQRLGVPMYTNSTQLFPDTFL